MKERKSINPWHRIERVWRATERIVMVFSVAMVVGTVGYLSIHAFV